MEKLKNIKLFVTDCDGVLTDGGMYYSEDGTTQKRFNCHDGEAFNFLRKNSIKTAIISGDESMALKYRNDKLKCDFLVMNSNNKLEDLKDICLKCKISLSDVLYVGDDLSDLEAMKNVGLSFCPCDAVENVKKEATYITKSKGGYGVIREITDNYLMNI